MRSGNAQHTPQPQTAVPASKPGVFESAEFLIPATAERIAASQPEPNDRERDVYVAPDFDFVSLKPLQVAPAAAAPAIDPRLAAMTHAIQTGDMDVFLSPIVALADHAVSHYEVVVRLRATSGEHYDKPEQILEMAGADLIGLFDSARLTRSATLAERLEARGKNGSVLSSITGQSITDGGFLETFARVYEERQSISGQLVLTLSQADVARLTPSAWQAIGDMHAFGFRFALEDIGHLDTDFDNLVRHGFAFAKLPAKAFLTGLPSLHGVVPSHEVCHILAKAGLTLIADAIDSDEVRARVFGFGILFGQGQLFGGARAMALAPATSSPRTAAA
jgi:cyclic-di-GMP phosphodiesterase, flagellum assembly factor TipF